MVDNYNEVRCFGGDLYPSPPLSYNHLYLFHLSSLIYNVVDNFSMLPPQFRQITPYN